MCFPIQLFQPFSQFIPAGQTSQTVFAVWAVDSQKGQKLADPTSHCPTRLVVPHILDSDRYASQGKTHTPFRKSKRLLISLTGFLRAKQIARVRGRMPFVELFLSE
jgi:hypothetical protein